MTNDFTEYITIRIPKWLRKTLEDTATKRMTNLSAVAREAIVKGLGDVARRERDNGHG